jgi:hypothetical protein
MSHTKLKNFCRSRQTNKQEKEGLKIQTFKKEIWKKDNGGRFYSSLSHGDSKELCFLFLMARLPLPSLPTFMVDMVCWVITVIAFT